MGCRFASVISLSFFFFSGPIKQYIFVTFTSTKKLLASDRRRESSRGRARNLFRRRPRRLLDGVRNGVFLFRLQGCHRHHADARANRDAGTGQRAEGKDKSDAYIAVEELIFI